MIDENWQSLLEDDLDILSEIINPVKDKTIKLKEGENRVVSIFFLDIKGFTSMSEKLHSEKLKHIIDRIFKVFTNVIIKYGGYIDKYEGDLIMVLFGSKKTSETDTERAIKSGLEILSKLKQINNMLKSQNIELSVRIGINTGLVTTGKVGLGREGDFTVYGDNVNIASRMESNAPLNSIMIPLKTKQLVTDIFKFNTLGKIQVKGKTEPIEVYIVNGLASNKIERWERTKLIKKPDYVGREVEFKKITEFYKNSQKQIGKINNDYKPFIIGLRGAAGLGKSRFIFEFVKKIEKNYKFNNITKAVVTGFTKSYAQAPYTLFSTLLKNYTGIAEIDSKETVKTKFEQTIVEICKSLTNEEKQNINNVKPVLGFLLGLKYDDRRLKNPNPKNLQIDIQLSLCRFLEAIAKVANNFNTPLIIIFEDLHWIDEASLSAFKMILTSINLEEKRLNKSSKNLFFLLSYRDEFKNLKEFEFRTFFSEFLLQPLTDQSSNKLIQSMLGVIDFPQKIKKELLHNSEGNPFFIEEWIHSLIDNNAIEFINDRWKTKQEIIDIPVPETLNNLILSRIDRMEERLKSLLQKASVIGNSFIQSILEAIEIKLGNKKTFNQELLELINMDWLIKEKELDNTDTIYLFKHIITCNVAYQTILNYNKKILHKIIADFAEEKFGTNSNYFAFLANHFEKAEVKDKAIEYLEKAGDFANKNYENIKALSFYNHLLTILEGSQVNNSLYIRILMQKGNILDNLGNWNEAEQTYSNALSLQKKEAMSKLTARLYSNLGRTQMLNRKYEQALIKYKRSFIIYRRIEDEIGQIIQLGYIGYIYTFFDQFEKAKEYYNLQLTKSKEQGYAKGIAEAYYHFAKVYEEENDFVKSKKYCEKDLHIRKDMDDEFGIARANMVLGNIFIDQEFYQKAIHPFTNVMNFCQKIGNRFTLAVSMKALGECYGKTGKFDLALSFFNKALFMQDEFGFFVAMHSTLQYKIEMLLEHNKIKKALEAIDKMLLIATEYMSLYDVFTTKIYKLKLLFKHSTPISKKYKLAIHPLTNLLKTEKNKKNMALLHKELCKMFYDLKEKIEFEKHKQLAIDNFKELNLKSDNKIYKINIDELQKMIIK
ncbi:MAG: tetratricopeptide repeat protein [Candidatus Cloacimonetes bacterium]|nr:tetratricopeptide repeat protein [Candidatus Cloacimonadota bacterium]